MRVFVFMLKSENDVYAFTTNSDYAEIFRTQRNMNLFNEKIISMDKYELMIFNNKMRNYQLCKDYLDDGEHDIEIIATVNESTSLSEACDYIRNTSVFLTNYVNGLSLKKKYLKSIINLTQSIIKKDDKNPTLNVNTFKLFYFLFRNTFSEYELPDSPKLNFLISYDEE